MTIIKLPEFIQVGFRFLHQFCYLIYHLQLIIPDLFLKLLISAVR